jgi:general secretion pathway protein G
MQRVRQRGFSMFEMVVALLVILGLYALVFQHLDKMTESVERSDFTRTLNRMQAQLTLQIADWYANGQAVDKKQLEQQNPVALLEVKPENYQGEISSDTLGNCRPSHWCYVTDLQRLVYRVKNSTDLVSTFTPPELLAFKLEVSFADPGKNKGLATGMRLRPIAMFRWQDRTFN